MFDHQCEKLINISLCLYTHLLILISFANYLRQNYFLM
mgnify:CR=1 FL=1|jgi:hypothetical protein